MIRVPLRQIFETQEELSEQDVKKGLSLLIGNNVCSMATGALQGGVFLSAFALALGATNYEIGLLATIGFLSQLMQLPGLLLLQKFGKRRGISVVCAAVSRMMWIAIVLIPFLFMGKGLSFLIMLLVLASLAMATSAPAWNSLLRDIVPTDILGRFFSRRLTFGMAITLVLTLAGGYFVDWWKVYSPDTALYAYSALFFLGVIFGVVELFAITHLPEPRMERQQEIPLLDLLSLPLKDGNFRQLLVSVGVWSFAVNMAVPFFIIYMLNRIGISLFLVTVLAVTSQLTNMLFLRIWGRLGDRFSNKAVMSVSGHFFLLGVLAWCFTTMPEQYALTLPLLFAIHILGGMSMAGVTLSSSNIALKLSPSGSAHAYMTVFGLTGAVAGAVAPLVGGVIADFFALRELSLSFNWSDPARQVSVYALNFRALDFLFGIVFLIGFYALNRLARVKEEGNVTEGGIVEGLVSEMAMSFRVFSTAGGILRLAAMPVHMLRRGGRRKENGRNEIEVETD